MDTGTEKIKVKIKPGAYDGLKLRVKGKGEKGKGGQDGNLYLTIHVQPNRIYERRGNDLYMEVPIDLWIAFSNKVLHSVQNIEQLIAIFK